VPESRGEGVRRDRDFGDFRSCGNRWVCEWRIGGKVVQVSGDGPCPMEHHAVIFEHILDNWYSVLNAAFQALPDHPFTDKLSTVPTDDLTLSELRLAATPFSFEVWFDSPVSDIIHAWPVVRFIESTVTSAGWEP
jgi:hypothetical protein